MRQFVIGVKRLRVINYLMVGRTVFLVLFWSSFIPMFVVLPIGVLTGKPTKGVPEVVDCAVRIVIGRPRTRRYAQDTGHKIYTGSGS
jgi:hypothetical protein